VPELNIPQPVSAAAETKATRLAAAYQDVFGQASRRTSSQKLVMDSMRDRACQDLPIFDADKIGNFDPLRAAHKDGARTIYLYIERQLDRARHNVEKTKPKTKR